MTALNVRVEDAAGTTRVVLEGEITEGADFAPLLAKLPSGAVFDLAAVQRINSCGVREWVNFVRALGESGRQFALERCSLAVVDQMNMISNFKGRGAVKSVFAPWYCASCNAEHAQLVEVGPETAERLSGENPCPTCGQAMEFNDLPDRFLAFASES